MPQVLVDIVVWWFDLLSLCRNQSLWTSDKLSVVLFSFSLSFDF